MTSRWSPTWPTRLEWGSILAFWSVFALLSIGQDAFGDQAAQFHWRTAAGELVEYGSWVLLTPLIFRLAAAFPVVEPLPTNRLRTGRHLLLHVATGFVVAVGIDLSEEMVEVATGAASASTASALQQLQRLWFVDELIFYLVVLMAGFARVYYLEKQARQEEAERLEARAAALEAQLTEARLEALRRQLNPHFLFNTLHAISTLVHRDPDGVRRMIARLSELLRHVLDDDAPQEVPLSDELSFLDDYLDIQCIRFQGALDTDIDVPPALHDARVPHLILQPIVENAIKHGAAEVRGVGRIKIEAHRSDKRLRLIVQDNGPGLPSDQDEGIGLRNVRQRLDALYGDNHAVRLDSPSESGTRVILELPYHTAPADSMPDDASPAPASSAT